MQCHRVKRRRDEDKRASRKAVGYKIITWKGKPSVRFVYADEEAENMEHLRNIAREEISI